jgi:hypothetical protein
MGLIVAVAGLSVAFTRSTRVPGLRRMGTFASRIGGGLLVLVGAYVAYYGWYEIRIQRDPGAQDAIIDAAGAVQRALASAVDGVGAAIALATVLAGLVIVTMVLRRQRR